MYSDNSQITSSSCRRLFSVGVPPLRQPHTLTAPQFVELSEGMALREGGTPTWNKSLQLPSH